MKQLLVFLFLINNILFMFSQAKSIEPIRLINFPNSKENGIVFEESFAGGYVSPEGFCIDNNKLYILETEKDNIKIFNIIKNYQIEQAINTLSSKIIFCPRIEHINSFIIGSGYSRQLNFFNISNNQHFSFEDYNLWKGGDNYFIIGNKVFYYDHNDFINSINLDGKILGKIETKKILNNLNKQKDISKYPHEIYYELKSKIESDNELLIGDRYYNTYFKENWEYWKYFDNLKENDKFKFTLPKYTDWLHFQKYDANHNSYWLTIDRGERSIMIFTKHGQLIEWFYTHHLNKENGNQLTYYVEPNGTIYIMAAGPDGTTFYKVPNTWDPISDKEVEEYTNKMTALTSSGVWNGKSELAFQKATVKEVYYSTYRKETYDQNAYHPAKIFDNNISTGWLEDSEGPGIGQFAGVKFMKSVTIDKIGIYPGWFDDKFWSKNNRLKKVSIMLDGKITVHNLEDIMKEQFIEFDSPRTFTKLQIFIGDVYKSNQWDDTALSEVKLYKNNQEIEIDLGVNKKYLEQVE